MYVWVLLYIIDNKLTNKRKKKVQQTTKADAAIAHAKVVRNKDGSNVKRLRERERKRESKTNISCFSIPKIVKKL